MLAVASNGAGLLYAVLRLVGPRQIWEDLQLSWRRSQPVGSSGLRWLKRLVRA